MQMSPNRIKFVTRDVNSIISMPQFGKYWYTRFERTKASAEPPTLRNRERGSVSFMPKLPQLPPRKRRKKNPYHLLIRSGLVTISPG